jgi:hypothetical protein
MTGRYDRYVPQMLQLNSQEPTDDDVTEEAEARVVSDGSGHPDPGCGAIRDRDVRPLGADDAIKKETHK